MENDVHAIRKRQSDPEPFGLSTVYVDRSHQNPIKSQAGFYGLPTLYQEVPLGTYVVGILRQNQIVAHQFLEVDSDLLEVQLTLPPPSPEDFAVVRVKLPSAMYLNRLTELRIGAKSQQGYGELGDQGLEQSDGSFLVPFPLFTLNAQPSSWNGTWIEVYHPQLGRTFKYFDAGKTNELMIELLEPAIVELTIADWSHLPNRHWLSAEMSYSGQSLFIGPDTIRFGPQQPGDSEVTIAMKSRASWTWSDPIAIEKIPVSLKSGKLKLSYTLPVLSSLEVHIVGAAAGERVSLQWCPELTTEELEKVPTTHTGPSIQAWEASSQTDSNGRAMFQFLPRGRYSVRCNSGSFNLYQTVVVPNSGLLTIVPNGK